MQGVFDASLLQANWGAILDPGVDEETEHAIRDAQAAAERARGAVRARGAAAPPRPPPPVPDRKSVIVPPVRFASKGTVFYVVKPTAAIPDFPPRRGKWGHYLVPCVVDPTTKKASPYPLKPPSAAAGPAFRERPGVPGISTDNSDKQPVPDRGACVEGRDFVATDTNPAQPYWEVGLEHLRRTLENAEALDLAFARRIEGLANVSPTVTWDCIDPEYDPSDREPVLTQYMAKYLEKFYDRLDGGSTPAVEAVTEEALHKHRAWCKAWAARYHRTLTPAVTAPAEALASDFYTHLQRYMPPDLRLTRMELARVLMRHEEFAAQFASSLHYYTANLEQTRGARNASYKQIRLMTAARVTSYSDLGQLLASKSHVLSEALQDIAAQPAGVHLHPLVVDWHGILAQVPPVHKHFDTPTPFTGLSEARRATAEGRVPPWRFGRQGE